jgi:hypothetical protein
MCSACLVSFPSGAQLLQRVLLRHPGGGEPDDGQRAHGEPAGEQRGGLHHPAVPQVHRLRAVHPRAVHPRRGAVDHQGGGLYKLGIQLTLNELESA